MLIQLLRTASCLRLAAFTVGTILVQSRPALAAAALPAQTSCPTPSVQIAALFPQGASAGDGIGIRVAIDAAGTKLVIAAPGGGPPGILSGAAWVISHPGTPQQSEVELVPAGAYQDMRFCSYSLDINAAGDVVVAGAPGWGLAAGSARAYVFRFDGTSWNEEWYAQGQNSDQLGFSVALDDSGDLLATGAPRRRLGIQLDAGAVELYRHQPSGWVLEATVRPSTAWDNHFAGNYIALSGDGSLLAVRSAYGPAQVNGAVYLFEHTAAGWNEIATLQEPVAYSTGGFGIGIALDGAGRTLAVGNFQDSRITYFQGAVSIFRKGPSGWAFETALLPTFPTLGCGLGRSVAINAAGDRVFAGVPAHELLGVTVGAVQEFERAGGAWVNGPIYFSASPQLGGTFGVSVATSPTASRWVAGEPGSDVKGVDAGYAHVFESPCTQPTVYCTAKTNSLGCVPQIGWSGTPSASSPSGFTITASSTRNQQNGMLFYGTNGAASAPWKGGTICVQPPLRRTPLQNAGGNAPPALDCSGTFALDFNTWTTSGADPALFAGAHVFAQLYSRDPGASFQLNLTDAVEFFLEP